VRSTRGKGPAAVGHEAARAAGLEGAGAALTGLDDLFTHLTFPKIVLADTCGKGVTGGQPRGRGKWREIG